MLRLCSLGQEAVGNKSILTGRSSLLVPPRKDLSLGASQGKKTDEAPKKTPWGTVTFVVVDWTLLRREHLEGDRRRGHQEMDERPWRCTSTDGWRSWRK